MIEEKMSISSYKDKKFDNRLKIEITEEEQKKAQFFLELFKNKGKCKRGFVVDAVMDQIVQAKNDPSPIIQELMKNCEDFIVETFKVPKKPKIQDYTTFFEILKFPIRFEELKVTDLQYKEKVFNFNAYGDLYCVIDDSNEYGKGLVSHLTNKGWKNKGPKTIYLMDEKQSPLSGTSIGIRIEFSYPFCKIEQMYFPFKHIYHYIEYLLWSEICDFHLTHSPLDDKQKKWFVQDKKLINLFKYSVENLFLIESNASNYTFTFRFKDYALKPDDINVIYNKYLFSGIYEVEKKAGLYNYTRFGEFKIVED
jgi:hypothetical protein